MTLIPRTQTVVSYSYTVKANGKRIGTLQEFSPDQTRALERVREIANVHDDMFEIVPGRTDFTITVNKLELYSQNMIDALGYEISRESVAQIRDPITVVEEWTSADGKRRTAVYDRCWIQSLRKTVREGTVTVVETAVLWPERIFVGQPK